MDQIKVPLVFEVGSTDVTLSQLKNLQEGYIFDLGTPTEEPVFIQSGGKTIARGTLVDIEGRTGVKIVEVKLDE